MSNNQFAMPGQPGPKKGESRALIKGSIESRWEAMATKSGTSVLSAKQVLTYLHQDGICLQIAKANAIGDVLGKHGFDLPNTLWEDGKRYLLSAIPWDEQEHAAFIDMSDEEKVRKIESLELRFQMATDEQPQSEDGTTSDPEMPDA